MLNRALRIIYAFLINCERELLHLPVWNKKSSTILGLKKQALHHTKINFPVWNIAVTPVKRLKKQPHSHIIGVKSIYWKNEIIPVKRFQKQAEPYIAKIKLPVQSPERKKILSTILVSLLVNCVAVIFFYFLFFNKENVGSPLKKYVTVKDNSKANYSQSTSDDLSSPLLSAEQIKTILDTTGINLFLQNEKDHSDTLKYSENILAASNSEGTLASKRPGGIAGPGISKNTFDGRYMVIDTAFFHNRPDESTRRKTFIDPLKRVVLKPTDNKNGFFYIVYTNQFKRTSTGWINQKVLRPL
jgi:hypothetical protein